MRHFAYGGIGKAALTRAGVYVQKIERGEPTLEDVFLSLAKDYLCFGGICHPARENGGGWKSLGESPDELS